MKKEYIVPAINVIRVKGEVNILAGSPELPIIGTEYGGTAGGKSGCLDWEVEEEDEDVSFL